MPRAVIVGTGQLRNKPGIDGPFAPQEPARMAATCLERAAADAGRPELLREADAIAWIPPIAWPVDEPGRRVAELLSRPVPPFVLEVEPGGDGPTTALNRLASCIAHGQVRIAMLAGAEALHGVRRAMRDRLSLDGWAPRSSDPKKLLGDQKPFASELERRHHVKAPVEAYPLLENALRARAGRSIADHQTRLGRLMERYSEVAARNPYSWFPERRSSDEILKVDRSNRWICFPYPKLMNAIIDVDQAAALIVMAESEADRLGIAPERRVHFLGGGRSIDGWSVSERHDLAASPAYAAAAAAAAAHAGCDPSDVDLFDLYSCFPSAVELALDAIGVDVDDPRGPTQTGGLAHHGGPGNNYAMHGLANTVDALRAGRGRVGWVSGLGMSATKHSISILSTEAKRVPAADGRASDVELPAAERDGPPLVDHPEGRARLESYTVAFDRDGAPKRAMYVLRLEDGRRTMAIAEGEEACFSRLLESEGVGLRGRVRSGADAEPNRFRLEA